MYDLNKMLDEVRAKYYTSTALPRPTISWSDEHWTAFYGQYTLYNNQITISRALNSMDISYEAVASVVYHESLHQDFPDHDRRFAIRANKFPHYKEFAKELNLYLEDYASRLKCEKVIKYYAKDKTDVIYVVLPFPEDFEKAFTFYNGNIYVETGALVDNYAKDNLTIFLVDSKGIYHIVAWVENAEFSKTQQKIAHRRFGGIDFTYSISAPRDNVKILFPETCIYTIEKKAFPASLGTDNFCVYNVNTEEIQYDLAYINSYCEGFNDYGMASFAINLAAPYNNIPYKDLYAIASSLGGPSGVWAANALCKMVLNFDTVFNRADALRDCKLITLAYEEMKRAHDMAPHNPRCIVELIKLCATVSDISLGNQLIKELPASITKDEYLSNSIAYITQKA